MKLIFSCTALALLFAGCDQSSNQPSSTAAKENVRTDVGPIAKRLPKLGQLQRVWWTSTQVTTDSALSPPSQPAYKVVGVAQLEKGKAEAISQQYQWQGLPPDWKPALVVADLDVDSAQWSQSAVFTKECKPQQIPGKLYFERQKGLVYFDLEIE